MELCVETSNLQHEWRFYEVSTPLLNHTVLKFETMQVDVGNTTVKFEKWVVSDEIYENGL